MPSKVRVIAVHWHARAVEHLLEVVRDELERRGRAQAQQQRDHVVEIERDVVRVEVLGVAVGGGKEAARHRVRAELQVGTIVDRVVARRARAGPRVRRHPRQRLHP